MYQIVFLLDLASLFYRDHHVSLPLHFCDMDYVTMISFILKSMPISIEDTESECYRRGRSDHMNQLSSFILSYGSLVGYQTQP